MARQYADEDVPGPVVRHSRTMGHDVPTAREAGNADERLPDSAALGFARDQDRAVATMNRGDSVRLHAAGGDHSGMVVCRTDPDLAGLAVRVDQAIRSAPSLHGRLIRVNRLA